MSKHTHIVFPAGANPAILEVVEKQIKDLEGQITGASPPPDDDRTRLGNELATLISTLEKLAGGNGPSNPDSDMFRAHADNNLIRFLAGYAFVGTVVAIGAAIPALLSTEVNPLIVVVLGALGAFLSYIQSFCRYVDEQKFLRSWFLYYCLYPLKGAGMALIVYLLLHTKIVQLKVRDGGPNNSLTAATYYFIAALSGMFSTNAIQMLSDLFSVIFRSVEGKDSLKKKQE